MLQADADLEDYRLVPKRVRRLLERGDNIMLHGAAGTGKSTILRAIAKHHGNCVVLSPTGIAALNVGGQTLHSFFGFSFGMLNPAEVKGAPRKLDILRKKPLIIIDEISMVRSDVFNAIDVALRKTVYNNLAFAGMQMLLLGDTGQLPPVVTTSDQRYFQEGSEMFFNSRAYKAGRFKHVELEEIHRQSSGKFIGFLCRVRNDTVKPKHLDWFNSKIEILSTKTYFKHDDPESTVLCMTNARADDYNMTRFEQLPGDEVVYDAHIYGKFQEAEYPTYAEMHLKVGTKVVMLKNARDKSYVNGSVGLVTKLGRSQIWVVIDGNEYKIEAETWVKYAYEDSRDGIEKKVIGSFKQIPVRLAWAVTVHKSQGMTLSRFHLDLERRPFTHGQMYVALSRARSIKGVTSTRPIQRADIIVDKSKLLNGATE